MLTQKITQDQIQALKNHDQEKVTTLRYILAQIKNKEIDKKAQLTDDEILNILRKIIKELNESIEAFGRGKREDLIKEYQKQLDLVTAYLPKEISDVQLKKEIETMISQNQELYDKNPKAIIGICMKELKSKANPGRIMKLLNEKLNSNSWSKL